MATSKMLVNDPESIVDEMIEGVLLSNPQLTQLQDGDELVHVVRRLPAPGSPLRRLTPPSLLQVLRSDFEEVKQRQVSVISGGGSGHEPAMVRELRPLCLLPPSLRA